jgi:ATP-binding cassette, subfamily B, bacterial PglK
VRALSLVGEIRAVLTAAQWRATLASQLISLLVALTTTVSVAAIAPFFAVMSDPGMTHTNHWLRSLYGAGGFRSEQSFVRALALGFVLLVLLANLISVAGFLVMHRLARRIGQELQATLFAAYLERPYAFHTATSSLTLLNNVTYETTRLTYGVLENSFTAVTAAVTALLIIASIAWVRVSVALLLVGLLAGGYLLIYLLARRRLLETGATQTRLQREQAQIAAETFAGIKEVILLNGQGFFRRRFQSLSREFLRAATHAQIVARLPRHLMECGAAAVLVALALLLGAGDAGLSRSLGSLTFLAFAAYRLLPTLQQLFAAVVQIRADRACLLVLAPDLQGARAPSTPPPSAAAADLRPRAEIRIEQLWFRYQPERPWVLRDVSLRIPAGATVGIVGANGSGKSTLMDLVAGLLTPSSGHVAVDGQVLGEAERAAWQRRIAYVPQHVFLLDGTLRDNIALGVSPAAVDERRLWQALRLAQLEPLVRNAAEGCAQRIGERGSALSGGQRQRIGIARALYREAAVLLLDEVTNALDGASEQELLATLAALRGRCTVLLIAHRPNTIRACDLLFELADGQIVGCGSYASLLSSSRGFRRLAGQR